MKKIKLLIALACFFLIEPTYCQILKVGDPGVTIDQTKFDADYPQMERWAKAGAIGGIPFIDSFDKTASIDAGSAASINTAINAMASSLGTNEKGLITLKDGTYTISEKVKMVSNVSLIGESRDGVRCVISMTAGDAFVFYKVENCGLYNFTIEGGWGKPKYDWNYGIDANREFANTNISVKVNKSTNCWLDKVTILNSAKDPLRCPADHNTFRDLIVDGCKRKAGGAEGYFFIQGRDNLITGCQITRIRHISLQGDNVEYNVVYANDFKQEVSFHSGDAGNNLIANNIITLPSDMPPVNTAEGDVGPYPETEINKPNYFAIMGPWSSQHRISAHPNYLYKNKCYQYNHKYGSSTPWSDDDEVYSGPIQIGKTPEQHIGNFPVHTAGVPSSGTLYAIDLGSEDVKVISVTITPEDQTTTVGEGLTLTAMVLPVDALDKSVTWSVDKPTIASVSDLGVVTTLAEGTVQVTATTTDGDFSAHCTITVNKVLVTSNTTITQKKVNVYPNPFTSFIYLENASQYKQYSIYSVAGTLIMQGDILSAKERIAIPLSNLVTKAYFIKLSGGGNTKTIQLLRK